MARELNPEEKAQELIRFNTELQKAQAQKELVAARIQHRNAALKAGVPRSMLPDPSQIRSMDDSTWNNHAKRMGRMGFHGLDEQGRALPAPRTNPLVAPARVAPSYIQGRTPMAGVTDGSGRVARAAGFETKLDSIVSNADKFLTSGRGTITSRAPLNEFSTTPADARAIADRYGTGDAKTVFDKTPGTRRPFIGGADGKNVALDYIAGGKYSSLPAGADPTLDPAYVASLKSPAVTPPDRNALNGLAALRAEPFRDITLASRAPTLNTDLTNKGPVFPVEPTVPPPPSAAESLGRQVRGTAINALNTVADVAITQPIAAASRVGNALTGLANEYVKKPVNYMANVAGDFVKGAITPAGVTNASASQFQVPTKENPVPVTPTAPVAKIDQSDVSLANFGLSEDELNQRKKLAFSGF